MPLSTNMKLYYVLLLFLTLSGLECMKSFNGINYFCTPDFNYEVEGLISTAVFKVRCLGVNNTGPILSSTFDLVFYMDKDKAIKLDMPDYSNNIGTIKIDKFIFTKSGFAFDWVHDTLYAIEDSKQYLMSLSMRTRLSTIVYNLMDFSRRITNMEMKDVQLDPHEQLLFVLVECLNYQYCSGTILLRSDLSGNGLKNIIIPGSYIGEVTFSVDIGNKKLYVGHQNKIHEHEYNGRLLRSWKIPYFGRHVAVVDDALFVAFEQGIYSYNSTINKADLLQVEDFPHELGDKMYNFKVLDARTQRLKRYNKYICDENCPDQCEVRSNGDYCFSNSHPISPSSCGISALTRPIVETTIVSQNYSSLGDFPWHAVLYNATSKQQFCGGTLISPRAVLTAAHCLTIIPVCTRCVPTLVDAKDVIVSFGKTYRAWNITEKTQIVRQVKEILLNDNYWGLSHNYPSDIALLILDIHVPVSNFVMPACLDNLNQLTSHQVLDGYVPGLGYTEECGSMCSNYSERLKFSKVVVAYHNHCYNNTIQVDKSPYTRLTTDKFCIGNGTVSPVQRGDSGGGLTQVYDGLHYVTGVVSVKIKRLNNGYSFGGLTNVSKYMDWLNRAIPRATPLLDIMVNIGK